MKRQYSCELCSSKFLNPASLRWHRVKEHGFDAYPNKKKVEDKPKPKKHRKAPAVQAPPLSVTFCPRCGCNIAAVTAAVNLSGG